MIIIPEIKTVVICVPRTGSTSLKKAVRDKYPGAFLPYRHMEASGVPFGYENWRKVGLLRKPLERLWSLYRYCDSLTSDSPNWSSGRAQRMKQSVEGLEFPEWLLYNREAFCQPVDQMTGEVYPFHCVRETKAENDKSQFRYLRPDLGTQVYRFEDQRHILAQELGLGIDLFIHENAAPSAPMPWVDPEVIRQLDHLEWDAKYANGWSDRIPFPVPGSVNRSYAQG